MKNTPVFGVPLRDIPKGNSKLKICINVAAITNRCPLVSVLKMVPLDQL